MVKIEAPSSAPGNNSGEKEKEIQPEKSIPHDVIGPKQTNDTKIYEQYQSEFDNFLKDHPDYKEQLNKLRQSILTRDTLSLCLVEFNKVKETKAQEKYQRGHSELTEAEQNELRLQYCREYFSNLIDTQNKAQKTREAVHTYTVASPHVRLLHENARAPYMTAHPASQIDEKQNIPEAQPLPAETRTVEQKLRERYHIAADQPVDPEKILGELLLCRIKQNGARNCIH